MVEVMAYLLVNTGSDQHLFKTCHPYHTHLNWTPTVEQSSVSQRDNFPTTLQQDQNSLQR